MLYLFRGLEDTLRGTPAGIADSARAPADKEMDFSSTSLYSPSASVC